MNPEQFKQQLIDKGLSISDQQMKQFDIYYQTLIDWNKKVNLTTIAERDDVYLKHFYDSLTVSFYNDFTQNNTICDVGAGAGFPSIPLKIMFPHLQITIVDSLKKRITFLEHLVDALQLKDVTLLHSRAEIVGHGTQTRAAFDVVMARAVARLTVLSELCLPLCKQNGFFIAMKGSKADEEVEHAKKAITRLGGAQPSIHTFTLPEEDSIRTMVHIEKQYRTPHKYPRRPGIPMKKPII